MSGRGESKLSPRRIAAAERARQALELRKGGASFPEIARRLDFKGPGAAYKAIARTLNRTLQEPAEHVRKLELERLDRLFLAIWPRAKRGDLQAIEKALSISQRRAKLLGLDAPDKIAPTDPTGTKEWQLEHDAGDVASRLLPELAARGAAEASRGDVQDHPGGPEVPLGGLVGPAKPTPPSG